MSETRLERKQFGDIVRTARQAKGLTQKQLGELCGYEGNAGEVCVRKWERNVAPIPIDRLRRLCAALDLPLDALIP